MCFICHIHYTRNVCCNICIIRNNGCNTWVLNVRLDVGSSLGAEGQCKGLKIRLDKGGGKRGGKDIVKRIQPGPKTDLPLRGKLV